MFEQKSLTVITPEQALRGRSDALLVSDSHFVLDRQIKPPFPKGMSKTLFGMGCFWGAERQLWVLDGVYTTAVGYAGGHTPNATYEEVCAGLTGHAEVVLVVYDSATIAYDRLLQVFWESHDPTQGMRQGADVGTQYRSAIYVYDEAQRRDAERSCDQYQLMLSERGLGQVTTEIGAEVPFYYAEDYHQQYLAKNPNGYCGLGGTGVCFPR